MITDEGIRQRAHRFQTSLLLCHPFAYRLKVQEGDEIVERPVDLAETFNYLLGLHVKKLREFHLAGVAAGILPVCEPGFQPGGKTRQTTLSGGRMPLEPAAGTAAATRLYRAVLGKDRGGKSAVAVSSRTQRWRRAS